VEDLIQIQKRDCSSSDAPWLAVAIGVGVVVVVAAAVAGRVNDVDAAQDALMLTLYSPGETDMMERGYTRRDRLTLRSDANYSALFTNKTWSGPAAQISRSKKCKPYQY
jgi:hypothetical protein